MKLEILAMGKLKDKRCRALMGDYMGRLAHYLPSKETCLRESKRTAQDVELGLREEAAEFAKKCSPRTIKVVMDERGELITSEALAQKIEHWMVHGEHHIAFMIGSANGLDAEWRGQADMVLALSPMTLPHELARVFLAEQLYRAMTIIRKEPYHK